MTRKSVSMVVNSANEWGPWLKVPIQALVGLLVGKQKQKIRKLSAIQYTSPGKVQETGDDQAN